MIRGQQSLCSLRSLWFTARPRFVLELAQGCASTANAETCGRDRPTQTGQSFGRRHAAPTLAMKAKVMILDDEEQLRVFVRSVLEAETQVIDVPDLAL